MARGSRSVKSVDSEKRPSFTPGMTPEDQEDQLISLAVDLAVKRLRDGTASNQLVSEIIKLGTAKERLTREKLRQENEMLKAKTQAIKATEQNGQRYIAAIKALRSYAGLPELEDEEFEDY